MTFFVLWGSCLKGQQFTEPSKLKQFNITVNFDDYTVKTQMLSYEKKLRTNNERVYLWYTSQRIVETYGGYDGKLLHGRYQAFYLNYQLKESGEIHYGLKRGKWKYWYPDGHLKEEIYWHDGVKSGQYLLYNEEGRLMAKGRFKKDRLDGSFNTYSKDGTVLEKKTYKNGIEKFSRKNRRLNRKRETKELEKNEERIKVPETKKSFLKEKLDIKNKLKLSGIFKRKKKKENSQKQPSRTT